MPLDETPLVRVPGAPADAGLAHGRLIADQLKPGFLEPYLRGFCEIKRLTPDELGRQAEAWFASLPTHFQTEIDAMSSGARAAAASVIEYLFADIAASGSPDRAGAAPREQWGGWDPSAGQQRPGDWERTTPRELVDGPMCSAMLLPGPRVARNCDWYTHLLTRGTAAVLHDTPGRIATLAVGIFGDIDVDTGINAAGLWLHAHTLYAKPRARTAKPRLSWLFWLRECLETCETLDEVDAMLARVERDRGIILIAAETTTGRGAIFEATIDEHTRDDMAGPMCATNHHRRKHPDDPARLARSAPGSTTARYERLRARTREGADLVSAIAAEGVEMRTPKHLRTIYAATLEAAGPAPRLRFSAGRPDGTPASSRGRWRDIPWPFAG
ncbi:MAG: C45 family autoproteolytic acyltransferase/hydrolase [Planctomycetota bacterium]